MEEEKKSEIQDDEMKEQPVEAEQPVEEAAAPEEKVASETPSDEKTKRHKGRHAHEKELESKLEKQVTKYKELNDQFLRLYSEFDNYRKRTAKEKIEMSVTASEGVIKDILPVFDDFDRALQNMEKNGNNADMQGVTLIYNKLKTVLKSKGLEEIEALDTEFNTDEHEALTLLPAPSEDKKGKVLEVVQKGYKLNGKVIRFARVVVGN